MKLRKVYGRSKSRVRTNVVVYCDDVGWTRVGAYGGTRGRQRALKLTTEEARVLLKALGAYLRNE